VSALLQECSRRCAAGARARTVEARAASKLGYELWNADRSRRDESGNARSAAAKIAQARTCSHV
jgi:hypothetical protein